MATRHGRRGVAGGEGAGGCVGWKQTMQCAHDMPLSNTATLKHSHRLLLFYFMLILYDLKNMDKNTHKMAHL